MSASLPDSTLKPIRKPSRDPMIIQMERAYRESKQYELDKLTRKESLYKRRLTLALNSLEKVQGEIRDMLVEMARPHLSDKKEQS